MEHRLIGCGGSRHATWNVVAPESLHSTRSVRGTVRAGLHGDPRSELQASLESRFVPGQNGDCGGLDEQVAVPGVGPADVYDETGVAVLGDLEVPGRRARKVEPGDGPAVQRDSVRPGDGLDVRAEPQGRRLHSAEGRYLCCWFPRCEFSRVPVVERRRCDQLTVVHPGDLGRGRQPQQHPALVAHAGLGRGEPGSQEPWCVTYGARGPNRQLHHGVGRLSMRRLARCGRGAGLDGKVSHCLIDQWVPTRVAGRTPSMTHPKGWPAWLAPDSGCRRPGCPAAYALPADSRTVGRIVPNELASRRSQASATYRADPARLTETVCPSRLRRGSARLGW